MNNALFRFAAQHNLSLIVRFHNEVRASLAKKLAETDGLLNTTKAHQGRIALLVQRDHHSKVFEEMLRCTTFLLMYAHAEEWFYHVWRTYARTCEVTFRGSIKRFKPVLKDGLKLDLSNDKNWRCLCDAEKVRDCLLHVNGRVSLTKNPDEIRKIAHERGLILEESLDRIEVSGDFLNGEAEGQPLF